MHSANSRAGNRDSLPSKLEARPPIAVAREGKDQRIFRQGNDEGRTMRCVGDTGIDGETGESLDLPCRLNERFCAD